MLVATRSPLHPDHAEWIVTLTTTPSPLGLDLIESWEQRMLAVEHRWPGARFLGWRTRRTPPPPVGPTERSKEGAREAPRQSQRALVIASLLRCPADEQRGNARSRDTRR